MIFLKMKAEWTDEVRKAAELLVEGFIRSGGRPTVDEWRRVDPVEREIMVDVRRRYDLEMILLQSGDPAVAGLWAESLPKEDRERILATLMSKAAAQSEGKKK